MLICQRSVVMLIVFGVAFLIMFSIPAMTHGQGTDFSSGHLRLSTRDVIFDMEKATGDITGASFHGIPTDLAGLTGTLFVVDGKTRGELEPIASTVSLGEGGVVEYHREFPHGLGLVEHIVPSADKVSFVLEFINKGTEQRWLETGIRLEAKFRDEWEFWDGYEARKGLPGFSRSRDRLAGTFPAAAVYTESAGVAIGIEPMQLLSYLRSSASSDDGRNVRFEYASRIVVDTGASVRVEFILFGFSANHGYRNVLQRYYDIYPAVFRPLPDVDRRVFLGGAQYMAWSDNDPEMCRRTYSGWEWCYAPFKRTGDIYGHREFWDYTPARPLGGFRTYGYEEFHKWRKEAFLRGENCDVAMMFYIPSGIWCEYQLADKEYAEARVREKGVTTAFTAPWVTGHDNEYRVFPYGNKYADLIYGDIRRVAEELDLRGFAFDVANGGVRIHQSNTEGVEKAPGRAFDEGGVFVDEGVAIALLMDYVHSITKDNRRLAVVSNPGADGVYMTIFRSDASMFEAVPWGQHGLPPEALRSRLGHKTMVWWEEWEVEKYLAVERLTPEELGEAFDGLVDFTILKSLHLGAIPGARYTQGVPRLGKVLPVLAELITAGWQPVPAVKADTGDGDIWLSRYGKGGKSYIVASNASLSEFKGALVVENEYLGPYNYIFTGFNGEELQNSIDGRKTGLEISLPSKEYFVGRTVLGMKPFEGNNNPIMAVARREDELASIKIEVSFRLEGKRDLAFVAESPDGYVPEGVYLNGRPLSVDMCDGGLCFESSIGSGDVLTVSYRSLIWKVKRDDILNFPFVRAEGADRSAVTILIPGSPSEGERYSAYRLQNYFKTYLFKGSSGFLLSGGPVPRLPMIISTDEGMEGYRALFFFDGYFNHSESEYEGSPPVESGYKVILSSTVKGDGQGIVELRDEGKTLFIGAGDSDRLWEVVREILWILDGKYEFWGEKKVGM